MNCILEHVWGECVSQDQVWALVSGMRPSETGKHLLVVLQAFIDDSRGEDGTFVLGGHIATVENWALFSKDWEELLPYGTLNKDGKYHFKMSQMAATPERMARVPAFFRVIEKYILLSVSCKIQVNDLAKAKARLHVPNLDIDFGDMANPYLFASRSLMDMFHNNKEKMIEYVPLDQNVDFIFDEQVEKKNNSFRVG